MSSVPCDHPHNDPDLTLLLGPRDSAIRVGRCPSPRAGRRGAEDSVHIVVHRNHGCWTHLYRVERDQRADRLQVHLLRVYEGDRVHEARSWALTELAGMCGD